MLALAAVVGVVWPTGATAQETGATTRQGAIEQEQAEKEIGPILSHGILLLPLVSLSKLFEPFCRP